MRAFARILAWVLAVATIALVLEGGLRVTGHGPTDTPVEYDPLVGWSNRASASGVLEGAEFEAHWSTDSLGLRRTPRAVTSSDPGEVVLLGDSFVFGTAADEHDTIPARLQRAWDTSGHDLVAINAGALGWDTGQAVRAFEERLASRRPAAVVLFAYENDLFWNAQDEYVTRDGPRAKLRIDPEASSAAPEAVVPRLDHLPWWKHTALGSLVGGLFVSGHPPARLDLGERQLDAELCVLLPEAAGDAELDRAIDAHTLAGLERLRDAAEAAGSTALVVTLPAAPLFEPDWRERYASRGLEGLDWSCERPIERFLTLADRAGLPALDATAALRAHRSTQPDERLFWRQDWHLTPTGNDVVARAVAAYLTDRVDAARVEPVTSAAPTRSPWPGRLAFWLALTALVTVVLQTQPRRGSLPMDALGAGAMIAFVMTIVLGGAFVVGLLPPAAGGLVGAIVVLAILAFVAYHLRDRTDTIAEVVGGFAWRGHWYLMPTLVVLIGLGSLLIVAASSPIVAPFVYTLF